MLYVCLQLCLCTTNMLGALGGQKGLQLWMVMDHHVDSGALTPVFCKNEQLFVCFETGFTVQPWLSSKSEIGLPLPPKCFDNTAQHK